MLYFHVVYTLPAEIRDDRDGCANGETAEG
jgi:hypothetical protein